jgi:hypothetical protein
VDFAEAPLAGVERPSPTSADQTVSYFAQTRGGYRVLGGGYHVWRSPEGYVRKILGKQVVDFSAPPSTSIDGPTARSAAIQALGLTSLPWVTAPGTWREPAVDFFYAPAPGGHVLVAQVDFSGAGLDLPFVVWLDAGTEAVLLVHDGTSSAVDPINDLYLEQDLLTVTLPAADANGEPIPHGTRSIFVAKYRDLSEVERFYLLSGPLELNATVPPGFYAPPRPGVWGYLGNADIWEVPHDTNGDGTFSIDDSASTESIAASYWGATETFAFLLSGSWEFAGEQWRGVDGYGEAVAQLIHPGTPTTPESKRNMAFAGWESFLGTNPPFRQEDFPQEAKFPVILYPGPDGRSYLRPESTAHELGHALLSAVARRSGQGTGAPTHLGQRGAIEEGLADIIAMATKERRFQLDPAWWDLPDAGRNARYPEDRLSPSFVGGPTYLEPDSPEAGTCSEGNDLCWKHHNSTIVSHWAFLLARGNGTDPQQQRCGAVVPPIASTPAAALKMLIQLAIDARQLLLPTDGFYTFAEITHGLAQERYSPEVAAAVATAWYIVGVNVFAPDDPLDGASDLDPFENELIVGLPSFSGYDVHVSTSSAFSSGATQVYSASAGVPSVGDIRTVVADDAVLDAGKTYYWRVVPHGENPTECSFGPWSFKASTTKVKLHKPVEEHPSGALLTDFLGLVRFKHVPGAEIYRLVLSETELGSDACDQPDAEEVPALPKSLEYRNEVYLGNSFDDDQSLPVYPQDGRFDGQPDKRIVFPDIEVDQDYYLYVRAESGDRVGTCTEFRIRKPGLGPFARLRPTSDEVLNDITQMGVNLDFAPIAGLQPGDEFAFTPSAGAVSYRLEVRSWYPNGIDEEDDLFGPGAVVYSDERSVGDPCLKASDDGNEIAWLFGIDCEGDDFLSSWAKNHPEPLHWRVFATSADGIERQAGTDGPASHEADFAFQIQYLPPGQGVRTLKDAEWAWVRFEKTAESSGWPPEGNWGSLESGFADFTPAGIDEAWVIPFSVDVWADEDGDIDSYFDVGVGHEPIPLADEVYVRVWASDDPSSGYEFLLDADGGDDPYRIDYTGFGDLGDVRFNVLFLPYAVGVARHPTVFEITPTLRMPEPEPEEPEPEPEQVCWDPENPPLAWPPDAHFSYARVLGLLAKDAIDPFDLISAELPLSDGRTQTFEVGNVYCHELTKPAEEDDIYLSASPYVANVQVEGATGWVVYSTNSDDQGAEADDPDEDTRSYVPAPLQLAYDSANANDGFIITDLANPCRAGCERALGSTEHEKQLYAIGTLAVPYQDCESTGERVYARVGPEDMAIFAYRGPNKCTR